MAPINIVLFGETGVGKSSVINLIAGAQVANTSPDSNGCTLSSQCHKFSVDDKTFHIWDTVGLEQPDMGVVEYTKAIESTFTLIQQLTQNGGLDLLLFCIRGNRITATAQSNYRLFYEVLCQSKVPIALVITHLEREPDMESWWIRNASNIEKYGIKSAGHACVTGLSGEQTKYAESKANVHRMLCAYNGDGKYCMPAEPWLIKFLERFGTFASRKKAAKKKDVLKTLTKRCKLDPKIAESLALKLTPA